MTNAAFVMRLAEAEERFLYTKMNELDQFDALKTSARSKAQFQIMCLAFDPGNTYGQTRVGTASVSERVCIRFNWNASTTIAKGQAYFRQVLTDGPVSRINFCTIPERPIGAELPVYGTYGEDFDAELSTYIERLTAAGGEVRCEEAERLAHTLLEENAEFARLSQSRVYENLSFRANVIAFLKAMVLYVAHGKVWTPAMEDFVRWSLRYDLWCKMHFFGEAIENVESNLDEENRRHPQNLLDLLPDTFTREEAQQMRQQQGIRRGSLRLMLSNWKQRGYITSSDDARCMADPGRQRFRKTEEYLARKYAGMQSVQSMYSMKNKQDMTRPRGIRNNNPLNIRRSADRWQGAATTQTDKNFVQFESMAYGYRAAWRLMQTYYRRLRRQKKRFTVENIIARWAPPNENDTMAYTRTVLMLSGLGGNENLLPPQNVQGYGRLARLMEAMTVMENGIRPVAVDTEAIRQGYDLAFPDNVKELAEWLRGEDEYADWQHYRQSQPAKRFSHVQRKRNQRRVLTCLPPKLRMKLRQPVLRNGRPASTNSKWPYP